MNKKELVKALDNGVIKCKIDGEIKQFTRNPDLTGLNSDIDEQVISKASIKQHDAGSSIGVYELGSSKFTTITNAEMTDIMWNSADCQG